MGKSDFCMKGVKKKRKRERVMALTEKRRRILGIFAVSLAVVVIVMAGPASAKSLYVIADINAEQYPHDIPINAYDIQPAPIYLVYQTKNYIPDRNGGAVGLTIDTDSGYLFVTFEFSGVIDLIDGTTMARVGQVTAPGATNLAGIVVDQDKQKVYTVDRRTNHLYIYSWDASTKTLTLEPGPAHDYHELPSCSWAYGIALDEVNDLLYVGDDTTSVKYYSTNDWTTLAGQFTVSHDATGIAIDVTNQLVYTGSGGPSGGTLLSKYDLSAITESTLNVGSTVLGVAVDPATGLVYITTYGSGSNPDRLIVYDSSLTQKWISGDIGNPTGICVPGKEIGYNPLNLSKDDGLADDDFVSPGEIIDYDICYDNTQNTFDVNNVVITDTLPAEVSFVSATGGGTYASGAHTVTWDIGTLSAGASQQCVQLKVQVDSGTALWTTITNSATIDSDETPPTTQSEDTNICAVTLTPGISVKKVANPISGDPSTDVTFTITVTNIGGCELNPVTVVDTLPGGMSYVSSSPAGSRVGNTITWDVGPLASGASTAISLVAHIDEGAGGMLENVVTGTGTPPAGADVTDSDTAEVEVLAKTIEPPTQTLIDVTTEIKSDGTVIEGEQFGWMTGNGNLLNNPPLSPGEAVGGIKYDEKMIGSNGTTELEKCFAVNTNVTPNLGVDKSIGYKSGDLGSLSHAEQVGMRYSGASPPLSSNTKCDEVNAHSEMVVTDVEAATETEVGITETHERDLRYGIDAEGKGSVSAGVDASASSMTYKDKSAAYGGNFTLHKKVDYTSKPSTSITTDLKGDRTVVEEGQFRGESGNRSLLHNDKMIGSNGTTEFEKCVDVSTSNIEVAKSIGYKSGDLGSLSHAEQVGMRDSSGTKCEDVNAYSEMVVTNATTETEVGITEGSVHYGIDAEGNGSVSAGVDAFVEDGCTDVTYEDKSNAYGNFTFEKEVGYKSNPP